MRVVVPAIGSRGDVQPYVNLCRALDVAGHHAVLATNPSLKAVVEEHGVRCAPVGRPVDMGVEAARIMERSGKNWMRGFIQILKLGLKLVEDASNAVLDLVRCADLVIVTDCASGAAEAEVAGVPYCVVTLQPRRIPVIDPRPSLGRHLQGLAWSLVNPMMMAPMNRYRRTLGRPPVRDMTDMLSRELTLLPVSPAVAPPDPLWPAYTRQIGYWRNPIPDGWSPDPRLCEFLSAGEPPVVVSLGVMSLSEDRSAVDAARLILDAIRSRGVRAVVQGWNGLIDDAELPSFVVRTGSVPHAWLFDHARAVVHHGGFGTTASALTAGKPAFVVAHLIDQFEWGNRVHKLGAGPAFLPRYKLAAETFRKSFDALLDAPEYSEKAAEIGARIRNEPDGLAVAVRTIEERFSVVMS
jgi:UDP:flavonoid glycosyltransferase YjiC (YdhE family)